MFLSVLLGLLLLAAIVALGVGLLNPRLVLPASMPATRRRVATVWGAAVVVIAVLTGLRTSMEADLNSATEAVRATKVAPVRP